MSMEATGWIARIVDAVAIVSLTVSVVGFIVFLLALSAAQPAFLLPGFSAFFVFTIVSLVACRLRKSIATVSVRERTE